MHNSNFSSSNGSTEDLFRDSIDSCDNDITEKVGPGTVCTFLGCVGDLLRAALWGLEPYAHLGVQGKRGSNHVALPSSQNMSILFCVVIWRSLSWAFLDSQFRAFKSLLYPAPPSMLQVSFLEKKVTELENDSLTSGGLKSKLKQENMQLVHRSGARWPRGAQSGSPVSPALSHLV